jgi:putative ABC transport system substrate-binding protein
VEATTTPDSQASFARMVRKRADAVVVAPRNLTAARWKQVVDPAARHRLPAIRPSREWPEAGGPFSCGITRTDFFRLAAVDVDETLKGANPSYLPGEQHPWFELIVNLKTAWAFGLTNPQSFLIRADQAIQ